MFRLQTEFNAVAILNLAGMVGWAIDIVTGAVTKYDPRNYDLKMRARSAFIDLEDLDRNAAGAYVVPDAHWMVVDRESGLTFLFEEELLGSFCFPLVMSFARVANAILSEASSSFEAGFWRGRARTESISSMSLT